ncbi:MAG: hypothetical protein M3483_02975 [Gemmatimonadota bacterium]|nr:hypothetical protein [Gemmatimonadota bacterium]
MSGDQVLRVLVVKQMNGFSYRLLLGQAAQEGVEKGRKVRIDATVVKANIHAPSDSSLLFDVGRVLARLLGRSEDAFGFTRWSDHTSHTAWVGFCHETCCSARTRRSTPRIGSPES